MQRVPREGKRVGVEGRLRSRSWDAEDGSRRSALEVVAGRVDSSRHRKEVRQRTRTSPSQLRLPPRHRLARVAHRDEIVALANELLDVGSYPDYLPVGLQVVGADEVATIACGVSASRELFEHTAALRARW